ncbi:MAG: extracellular solute-binding protein [Pirellulales bacterium]|nr:extracellular solute-binding protein [Pirellulales bacterium]
MQISRWLVLTLLLIGLGLAARWLLLVAPAGSGEAVVVYCALDREFSAPVFDEFTRQTGIPVAAKYDVESTKTVGLVQALISEAARPRCDVFWNNEILHTLRLQEHGLLDVYRPPGAEQYPAAFRDPTGRWHGFAARARVLLVRRELVQRGAGPNSILALTDVRWRGRAAIAKPLFGTTATHAACLFATWGRDSAERFFRRLRANGLQILAGNKQVAQAVASGQVDFGLTDTDDAIIEVEQGQPVEIVYPDQAPDQLGTLFLPNSVCLLRGAPHRAAAQRLIDYVLSPAVEARLAAGASAQIPLNPQVAPNPRVASPRSVRAMQIDFAAAAQAWDQAAGFLRAEFSGP